MPSIFGCAGAGNDYTPLYFAAFMDRGGIHIDTGYTFADTALPRLQTTFQHYGHATRVHPDRRTLLIPRDVASDTEYVANLIEKAFDSAWYYEHMDPGHTYR